MGVFQQTDREPDARKGDRPLNPTSPPLALRLSRVKLFLALSRTPHGLLDLATPALAALLWYGGLPPFGVIALGLLTVFAGYTAVYALNDVVDYRVDAEKLTAAGPAPESRLSRRHLHAPPPGPGAGELRAQASSGPAAWAAGGPAGAYSAQSRLRPISFWPGLRAWRPSIAGCSGSTISGPWWPAWSRPWAGLPRSLPYTRTPPRVGASPVSVALLLGDRRPEYPRRLARP